MTEKDILVLYINGEKGGIKGTENGKKDPKNGTKEPADTQRVMNCKVGKKESKKIGKKELTERQLTILGVIRDNRIITIPEIAAKTNISERTISREINYMTKMNALSRRGGRKEGVWMVR